MEKIEKLDLKHNYAESIANRMFVTGGLSSFERTVQDKLNELVDAVNGLIEAEQRRNARF